MKRVKIVLAQTCALYFQLQNMREKMTIFLFVCKIAGIISFGNYLIWVTSFKNW